MTFTEFDLQQMQARLAKNRRPEAEAIASSKGVERESDLHEFIRRYCLDRGWLAFHGSMAHRTKRTLGEPDWTILTPPVCQECSACSTLHQRDDRIESRCCLAPIIRKGGLLMIECKDETGKLSVEQEGVVRWAAKLGHKIHVVRSVEAFLLVVKEAGL